MKPHLISFKLCPFVQRSVIVLLEKNVEFDIEYINLQDPPAWFKEISPLGKVPMLKVGDTVLFESAVIMEYLDEVNPPSLHPADPLQKAQNRAWTEFASTLFMAQFNMAMGKEQSQFEEARKEMRGKLEQLEGQVKGPFFNGDTFHLVDVAYAPLFMRLNLLQGWHPMGLLDGLPRIQQWSKTLLERPSVKSSVVAELPELYHGHICSSGSYCGTLIGE